jgi:outer membrane protein OmpA-like peptidoglycan-associated protein
MKRRPAEARTPASAAGRRTQAGSPGPSGAAGRMLGLNQALGNQAMGALLAGQTPGLGAAREAPGLLGSEIPAPAIFRAGSAVSLTVYFGKGFFLLDARNLQAVEALAGEIRLMAEPTITVDGHASSEGDAGYNQALSEHRRDLVIALLGKDREPRPTFGGAAHGEDAPAVAESGEG